MEWAPSHRWNLQAGIRYDDATWDAYEAPFGNPLVRLIDEPKAWESVRYWLADVAKEYYEIELAAIKTPTNIASIPP